MVTGMYGRLKSSVAGELVLVKAVGLSPKKRRPLLPDPLVIALWISDGLMDTEMYSDPFLIVTALSGNVNVPGFMLIYLVDEKIMNRNKGSFFSDS